MASTLYPGEASGRIDVFAYLVQLGELAILVDTGVGEGNRYIEKHFEPRRTSIIESLKAQHLAPGDINVIVNSHLHFDHCGNNQMFPNAQVYVQEAELAAAAEPMYTVNEWYDYAGADVKAVDGDTVVTEGVTLLSTPGHTPGHQAVMIESDGEIHLIAAQAAYRIAEYLTGGDPDEQAHPGLSDQYVASINKLKGIGAHHIYFSHDAATLSGE